MPWDNKGGSGGPWGGGGSGGNGGSPWGRPQGGGGGGGGGRGPGGPTPPDVEELLRRGQDNLKKFIPGGGGNKILIGIGAAVLVAIWLFSGFYRVQPNEQGVVLRFGEWINTTQPGLHYHLPTPIETVITPDVTRENRIEVGFRSTGQTTSRGSSVADVPEESLMLTGDENIVDIDFVVFWRIQDAGQFLFNIRSPDLTVKAAAESVMREIVGQTPIQTTLTEGRLVIEQRAQEEMQRLLNEYLAGIEIRSVQLQAVDPPQDVIDAFNEVQRAKADKERTRNEAEAYRNDIVPRARGQAERLIQEARAYKEEVVERSTGDANRFNQVYAAYSIAEDVTKRRIYLETLEQVLGGVNKVIIDDAIGEGGGQGVVPYLPLPEVQKRQQQSRTN
ncbi:MAG: FtsH protease activity modulator HflK [Alphaproteobacteria bacterium]|nr:FtsH protease activity modulator HflK [Alphaproteobacteria bacterium]